MTRALKLTGLVIVFVLCPRLTTADAFVLPTAAITPPAVTTQAHGSSETAAAQAHRRTDVAADSRTVSEMPKRAWGRVKRSSGTMRADGTGAVRPRRPAPARVGIRVGCGNEVWPEGGPPSVAAASGTPARGPCAAAPVT